MRALGYWLPDIPIGLRVALGWCQRLGDGLLRLMEWAKLRAPAEFGAPCDLLPRVRFKPAGFGGVGNIRLGSGCRPSLPVGTISETVSVMLIRRPSDGSRVQRGQANSTGEPLV